MTQTDSKSFSGQGQQQTAQMAPYPSNYPLHFEEDTINLYELWLTLLKWKWLVIVLTVVATLGAIVYAQQIQHIYKAEALLLPPKTKSVQFLNQFKNTLVQTSPDSVFGRFRQNLRSRTLQKEFIQEKGLMKLLAPDRSTETRNEDIYKQFSNLIQVGGNNGITSLSIELHNAEIAAQWVNDFTIFIDKETVVMLVEDLQNEIANQVMEIESTISSKRQMAKKRRNDQIQRYKEAADVAELLGIKRRVDATNVIQNTQMNVDIATATTPLYYLGYEALMSEIKILENRESDDPFIVGLRDLQEEVTLLRAIKFDNKKISTVYIDQAAYPTKDTIKPRAKLIVSIATIVSLISGIFLAFFIEFINKQRKIL